MQNQGKSFIKLLKKLKGWILNMLDVSTQLTGLLFLILFISVAWVFGKSFHSNYKKKVSFYEKAIKHEAFSIYVCFSDHSGSFGGVIMTLNHAISTSEHIKDLQVVIKDQFKLEYIPVIVSWKEI